MTETGRTAAQGNFSFGEAQAASRRIVFQTFRPGNHSVFPQKLKPFRFPANPIRFVIARRAHFAPDAAILNETKRHPETKYGESE